MFVAFGGVEVLRLGVPVSFSPFLLCTDISKKPYSPITPGDIPVPIFFLHGVNNVIGLLGFPFGRFVFFLHFPFWALFLGVCTFWGFVW